MLTIYTDGACKAERLPPRLNANPKYPGQKSSVIDKVGKGGWAWWVNDSLWDSGAVSETTNNRMEMLAVIEGLVTMQTHYSYEELLIISDSAYVVNCFHDQWYEKWIDNGWRNSSNKAVKNRDLWERLIELFHGHRNIVRFRHCRGHGKGGVGDAPYVAGNAQADRLAVNARLTLERER